jgi:UDP-N-acetyl-2-amino-2-deoxyglucuronate dehydrogenase
MRFALIGAAGYIAPKHMDAINSVGGDLVAAYDPSDSVGILDKYFSGCEFFTEFERFDRHFSKLQRVNPVDYVVVCSPTYLHDSHCRWALRSGASAICEKPLVVYPHNLDGLAQLESESMNLRVWNILQMRLHKEMVRAKEKYLTTGAEVTVDYVTPRGRWYGASWKSDDSKSGGILMNIGVHLFDVLGFIFGGFRSVEHVYTSKTKANGVLLFDRAYVKFNLSVDPQDLPPVKRANRVLMINGERFDVSEGFTDLHQQSYKRILKGEGFGINEARQGIEVVTALRESIRKAA